MLGIANNSAPGVYFETVDLGRGRITTVRTDIAAFLGIATRGPVQVPMPVESWAQFQTSFGGLSPSGFLAYSVRGFFDNGGRRCHVLRIASASSAKASAIAVGGDGNPSLQLYALSEGSWGDQLAIRAERSSPGASLSDTADPQPADRRSSILRSIAGFEKFALVSIRQDGVLGPAADYRIVLEVDPVLRRVHWDRPLAPIFDLGSELACEVIEFGLSVLEAGLLVEVYQGLSLLTDHPRHLAKAMSEQPSQRLAVVDLQPTAMADLPDAGALAGRVPAPALISLTGGADGLADLRLTDFTGDPEAELKTGIRALEDLDEVAMVAIPDIMVRPEQPRLPPEPLPVCLPDPCLDCPPPPAPVASVPSSPSAVETPPIFTTDDVFRVQQALVAHCEAQRNRIAILDPPLRRGSGAQLDAGEIGAWRRRFETKYAALYHPWLLVGDPVQPDPGALRAIPPSGHVAGLYARTDLSVGPHKAPANAPLNGTQDVAVEISGEVQAPLNQLGVNCIRSFPGRGIRVFGARTLSSDPAWRFVNVRRLLMMIEVSVGHAMQWAVFEPHDVYLRQTVRIAISTFLAAIWRAGALVGETVAEAFYVKCDASNNPPSQAANGRLLAEVGVAAVRPAEFVVFRIGRTEDALQVAE